MSTARSKRPYVFYDVATSVCSTCLMRCEAKILFQDDRVWMEKWCPDHGKERVLVAEDLEYWRRAREQWLRPAERPVRFQTPMKWGCPYDCGLCPDHQQHACLTVLEVTDHCNLSCPVCYASSGPHRPGYRSLEQVEAMLDAVVHAEGEPDVVQLSGGEPTLHPQFLEIVAAAKARPIRHLMINTNGIRLAKEPELAQKLAGFLPGVEIYLQFDSLRARVHQSLRGADLRRIRQQALENLEAARLSTTLVVTLKQGLNDDEVGEILDHALTWRCVRGVTFQPIQEAGRVEDYDPGANRLTLTGVRNRILEQSSLFQPDDLVPVPCHPDALVMAYGLKTPDGLLPLTRFLKPSTLLEGADNTVIFEQLPGVKAAKEGLFSTGLSPEEAGGKLADLLCCLPRVEVQGLGYEDVFRVMVIRFADARDFDLRSVKRCCIQFVQPDGKLIPFDTFNLFYRDGAADRLAELRARVEHR